MLTVPSESKVSLDVSIQTTVTTIVTNSFALGAQQAKLTGRKAVVLQKEEKKKGKNPESHKLNKLENENHVRYQNINRNSIHQTAHVCMAQHVAVMGRGRHIALTLEGETGYKHKEQ